MPRLTRMVLVLVLTSMLTATVALAQAPSALIGPRQLLEPSPPDVFNWLWSRMAFWSKNGCEADPDGRCLTTKNGCEADPDGRCLTTKNGCEADPSGARCQ